MAETLDSLYSHVLLILTKSSKFKNQVVREQKFKDLISSIWQVRPEMRVLDLESEVSQRSWFNIYWGSILLVEFLFSCSKASDANIGIAVNFV